MNKILDFLIPPPLPEGWAWALTFVFFSLHFLFVLLTLGTAMLGAFYFFRSWRARSGAGPDLEVIKPFTAHKSLAVVFGVGPLLLIQVGSSVPFFFATGLSEPWWTLLIVLMIAAFLLFEAPGAGFHEDHPYLGLVVLTAALITLLAVPAIFAFVLSVAEHPRIWRHMARTGLPGQALSLHWVARYLHVLGAAIIFGGAFHYFAGKRYLNAEKREAMPGWMAGGILFQFIGGPLLLLTVSGRVSALPVFFIVLGIVSAAALLWYLYKAKEKGQRLAAVLPPLVLLLVSMLLARQVLQDAAFSPVIREAARNRASYAKALEPFRQGALDQYKARLSADYDSGQTIFAGSCAFCHGTGGAGDGPEAHNMSVPPEDISSIRASRDYLYRVLLKGVPDTSMPYFAVFEKDQVDSLIGYLDRNFNVLGPVEPVRAAVSGAAEKEAAKIFAESCSTCHGTDGRGGRIALRPAPPDFTQYNLNAARAFKVVSEGYPGTAMPPFAALPVDVRWGLVRIINGFYGKKS